MQDFYSITSSLDKNKITLVYFSYSWWEIFKSPLLLATKLQGVFTGGKTIDHVAHICDYFENNEGRTEPEIFEASVTENKMIRTTLSSKLSKFKGTVIFEELDVIVNKKKAKQFENAVHDFKYSKWYAFKSGVPFGLLNWLPSTSNKIFCSRATLYFIVRNQRALFLTGSQLDNTSPKELYNMELYKALGGRRLIYKK